MIVDLHAKSDERGSLVAVEANKSISFGIERVYYIYGAPGSEKRGFHAHRELQQLMICTSGECVVTLDDGEQRTDYSLNSPSQGLFVDKMIWREMSGFSDDAVLLVIASHHYDEDDYIFDYEVFRAERQQYLSSQ